MPCDAEARREPSIARRHFSRIVFAFTLEISVPGSVWGLVNRFMNLTERTQFVHSFTVAARPRSDAH